MSRWPWVARELLEAAYDERDRANARADRLLDELLKLRREGFEPRRAARVREAPPDPEIEGLKRAEQQLIQRRDDQAFVERAVADIKRRRPDISDEDAREEAVRLRRSVTDQDPPT